MKKFGKNREVSPTWLNIPIKYMFNVKGCNNGSPSRSVPMTMKEEYEYYLQNFIKWDDDDKPVSYEEYKNDLEAWRKERTEDEWMWRTMKNVPAKHDKEFCIIELSKKWAICGWRNTERCSIGMPIKCRVTKQKNHIGLVYKDKFYPFDGSSGWVL